MLLKPGSRLKSAACNTEVAIVRIPTIEVTIECGGHAMIPQSETKPDGLSISEEHSLGTLIGKRYFDETTGLEVLCTKPGKGLLSINGTPIPLKDAKPLPSSD